MAALVTIPISIFEVTTEYARPEFKFWLDRPLFIQEIFDAFKAWQPRVDDVDAVMTGKLSEQGITIKLPLKRVSFFFGPASCKLPSSNGRIVK